MRIAFAADASERPPVYGAPMRLWPLLSRHVLDGLAVLGAVLATIQVWTVPIPGPRPAILLGVLLATLPLLARRRFPLAASACVFATLAGMTFLHRDATASADALLLALLLAFWSVGAHAEPRPAVAGLLTGLAAIVIV